MKRSVFSFHSDDYLIRLIYLPYSGIHDLKGCVSEDEYKPFINFMLGTKEEVDKFVEWVRSLKNAKVQGYPKLFLQRITLIMSFSTMEP